LGSLLCSFLLLTCLATTQSAFAQTPNAVPVARLLVLARSPSAVTSRPRRVSAAKANGPSLNEATDIERRAFDMTNTVRLKSNLAPLTWDPELCRMARIHSENMVRRGFFSHQTRMVCV